MVLKVNPEKVKAAFKEQEEKVKNSQNNKSNPKESLILKPVEEALDDNLTQRFRALPYVHSENPEGDPFPIRGYHYIPGVGMFYCPQVNNAEDCHVCEFVWARMKENKGDKEVVKAWQKHLPDPLWLLVPGVARGREDEGVKFLRINTYRQKLSDRHKEIMRWFQDEDYEDWMDPEQGRDIKIVYEEPDANKKKALNTNAKYFLNKIELAGKPSPLSHDALADYEEFLNNMPNIDEELYPVKTESDSLEALKKWQERLNKNSNKSNGKKKHDDSDDTEISGKLKEKEETKKKDEPEATDLDELQDEIDSLMGGDDE